jgi:hypothetical protein
MAFTVRLSNFTGTTHFTQVDDTLPIEDFKQFLATYLYNSENVHIFKNSREITSGTIQSNGIRPDDTLNIVCKVKTGFDLKIANQIKIIQDEYYNKMNELREEIEKNIALLKTTETQETKEKTPLELLGSIQKEREITENDYEKEDMRILFQRCRDQIEDEAKKMQRTEKENERTRQKLEALKKKMSLKKKKGIQKACDTKNTFGGFKKGFLLK